MYSPTTIRYGQHRLALVRDTERFNADLGTAYRLAQPPFTTLWATDKVYIELTEDAPQSAADFAVAAGLQVLEQPYARSVWAASTPQADTVAQCAAWQEAYSYVAFAEPELLVAAESFAFPWPTDELLGQQWYLQNYGADPHGNEHWKYRHGADAKVIEAWQLLHEHTGALGSSDITIAVVDKGFDLSHPDFQGKIVAARDFHHESSSLVPAPFAVQRAETRSNGSIATEADHGTACAGIALASANGAGIVGVAPNAKFMPIRYYVASGRFMREMFRHMMRNGADVASCSFGNVGIPMDRLTMRTLHEAATKGRNGKGMVIVFATGNAFTMLQSNELATHPDVIAVGASTSEDTFAPYTNRTRNMSVVAPGGYGHSGLMTTTDVGFLDALDASGQLVSAGYGSEETPYYRMNAEGTSFACPVVAGVAALVLSANPDLTAAEVKSILEKTADKIGDAGSYDERGHSTMYGYGRINAANAVRMALGLPLQAYQTAPADVEDIPVFAFDYGTSIEGVHDVDDDEVIITVKVEEDQAGQALLAELEVGLMHDPQLEFELYVQLGRKPVYFPEDFIDKHLSDQPRLLVPRLEVGTYYFMIRCIDKREWSYVKGGGAFTLTFTFAESEATLA